MWIDNAADWIERVKSIADDAIGLHNDLGTVAHRIERDSEKMRSCLESGCAYRLIRFASAARSAGQQDVGKRAHALAAEVVLAECAPSPDWATMCAEEGWPVAAGDFAPFVYTPTPEECREWGLDDGETALVRADGVWIGGTPRRPAARRVAGCTVASRIVGVTRGT